MSNRWTLWEKSSKNKFFRCSLTEKNFATDWSDGEATEFMCDIFMLCEIFWNVMETECSRLHLDEENHCDSFIVLKFSVVAQRSTSPLYDIT